MVQLCLVSLRTEQFMLPTCNAPMVVSVEHLESIS
jgi:hypothetical protein